AMPAVCREKPTTMSAPSTAPGRSACRTSSRVADGPRANGTQARIVTNPRVRVQKMNGSTATGGSTIFVAGNDALQSTGGRSRKIRGSRRRFTGRTVSDGPDRSAPPRRRGPAVPEQASRGRRRVPRHLRGPLLRVVRGVQGRGGAGGRPVPDPPDPGRATVRGELLLPPVALPGTAAPPLSG